MALPFWNHVARLPRHRADRNDDVVIEIVRGEEDPRQTLPIVLTDVSRNGAQFETDQQLMDGELLTVRIRDIKSEFEVQMPATVRWQQAEEEGIWSVGCRFHQQLQWEVYGELFLNGVLESGLSADD